MKTAIFPGTFEIFHEGHNHILEKALKIFDHVYVVVANNPNKNSSLIEERLNRLNNSKFLINKKNVSIEFCNTKISDIAKIKNTCFIIRGVRNIDDFVYEQKLNSLYKKDYAKFEVIYFFADDNFKDISSKKILKG